MEEHPTLLRVLRNLAESVLEAPIEMRALFYWQNTVQDAVMCPKGLGNPFIHLRLGQCQFERGNLERAADELMRAYMWSGADIFAKEDPGYLLFLGTVVDLSPPDAQH